MQDFISFLSKLPKSDKNKYVDKNYLFNEVKNNIYKNIDWQNLIRELEEERQKELFDELIKPKLKEKYKDKSKYLKVIDNEFEYKRISEINKNFKIFDNTLDSTKVKQGKLGTCYLIAVISTLSNYGQLLFQLFPNEKINMEGFYEICLYYQGKWVKVLVDDYFVFEKNSEEFAFTQPINDCLYSCLLEKAYAKIRGSYADINGGNPCQAFEALTGFESFDILVTDLDNILYNYFIKKIKDGYLFTLSTDEHAYSLIDIFNSGKNNKQFKLRNPWDEECLDYILEEKIKDQDDLEHIKFGDNGISTADKVIIEKYFTQVDFCQMLFNSSVYYYELKNISVEKEQKLYIYLELCNKSKIAIGLYDKNNIGEYINFKLGYKNMETLTETSIKSMINYGNKNEYNKYDFKNLDYYVTLDKSKYLFKMDFSEIDINNKTLKIIIEGDPNIKFLGFHHDEPDINSAPENVEFKYYKYGEETGKLFKKYKTMINLIEKEFNIKMNPYSKGFYIETIFTNEIEAIIRFDKEKITNQICSYDKIEDTYFIGNKHNKGKIVGKGKAIILSNNVFFTVYSGEILNNKISCEFIDTDDINSLDAILKIPQITLFNKDSKVKSKCHEHKLNYKSVQDNWRCYFCYRFFDKNFDSFGCKECNFNICFKCLFIDDSKYSDSIFINFKFDNLINKKIMFFSDFIVNNKNNMKIILNEREFNLDKFFRDSKSLNPQEIQIQLKGIKKLKSMKNMFCTCNFKAITFFNYISGKKTNAAENMFGMFYGCKELEYVDLSAFETSKVIYMNYMFFNCNKLKEIKGINNFNTKKVINLGHMFYECNNLQYIDLSGFDTSNVVKMNYMFYNCNKLKEIKGINKFNANKVIDMSFMFNKCKELKYLDISNFGISKLCDVGCMFSGCEN